MSGHERERLSAYLDGELDPAARAEVEGHLASCPDCAALLADLAAVDEAARALPAEAPPGYFESFPARVRARLQPREARAQPRPLSPVRRLPAWTWAAAAALLLAVITPLTLRQGRPAAQDATRHDESPPAAKAVPNTPHEQPAAELRAPEPESPGAPAARAPARASSSAPRPPARVAAPEPRRDQAAEGRFAPEPAAAGEASSPSSSQMSADAATEGAAGAGVAGGVASPQSSSREGIERAAPPPAAPPAAARPMMAAQSADEAKPASLKARQGAFGRLEAARPRTAAGWRSVREQWKAMAAAESDPVRADEERVRAVIAAREAWRAEADESDLAAFRAEAESYLGREDARQKERVSELLAEAPRRTP